MALSAITPQVTGQRQRQAGPGRRAREMAAMVGFGIVCNRPEVARWLSRWLMDTGVEIDAIVAPGRHGLDITAGAKGAASPGQDDRAHGRVRLGPGQLIGHGTQHIAG